MPRQQQWLLLLRHRIEERDFSTCGESDKISGKNINVHFVNMIMTQSDT